MILLFKKVNYNTKEEKEIILLDNKHLHFIEDADLLNERYLIFSDKKYVTATKELEYKISILEAENADLLLDSAIKDMKLKSIEKDLADLTLEVVMGGM